MKILCKYLMTCLYVVVPLSCRFYSTKIRDANNIFLLSLFIDNRSAMRHKSAAIIIHFVVYFLVGFFICNVFFFRVFLDSGILIGINILESGQALIK